MEDTEDRRGIHSVQIGRWREQTLGGSDAGRDISSELHSGHSSAVQDRCRGSTAPHRGGPAPPAAAASPSLLQTGRQAERRW